MGYIAQDEILMKMKNFPTPICLSKFVSRFTLSFVCLSDCKEVFARLSEFANDCVQKQCKISYDLYVQYFYLNSGVCVFVHGLVCLFAFHAYTIEKGVI